MGYQPKSGEKNSCNKSIACDPDFNNPKETSIKVEASKTNRWKRKTEIIYTHCNYT